ncbi:MAG: 50S ribosomal protein L23 [Candidatus Micrarchaeaceae archaeon]
MALLYPLATEKSINLIEKRNTITYIADIRATKKEIKDEFEKLFGVKVQSVNLLITPRNKKKAYIKLKKEYNAKDVAIKLKLV